MKADNSPSAIGVWSVPVELLNDSSVFMGLSPLQIYCAAMIAAGCNEHHIRNVGAKQLDDGIGDTVASVDATSAR
jgi:hypothetical protein